MALDGALLSFLAQEINNRLEGARVDRVQQPEKDEIDLIFRLRGGSAKLLLSASANNPRVHFTALAKENPLTAPMFCMLLRKHLAGAKFAGAAQQGLERILNLNFDCRNDFGDEVRRTLVIEIMGRHSNIMLLDENGRILDSVKHIDHTMSSVRQVLPGLTYALPPLQDKLDVSTADCSEILARIEGGRGELHKALLGAMQGVSPIVCRELAHLACRDTQARVEALTPGQKDRLVFFLRRLKEEIAGHRGIPCLVADAKSGKPLDFSFLEVTQYGTGAAVRKFASFSELLDAFYTERDRIERVNQRSRDILTVITASVERISRKIDHQNAELAACADRSRLKIFGDLISSNLYRLAKGMDRCVLENYYEEGSPQTPIDLDPSLSPAQNAQKYYREYRKASVAEKYLIEQVQEGKRELSYLDSVFDELSRASGESELQEIREELVGEGYVRHRGKRQSRQNKESAPLRFRSDDGFTISVGRNNRQNDRLTLRTAAKGDLWLHVRNMPGAHVIVSAGGAPLPDRTVEQAAILAASHSRARESAQVPIDYTLVKNVKKPTGAKPGMVIYEDFKTAFVTPDPALCERLKI